MLLVDRLLTESTLEAAIESRNRWQQATPSASQVNITEFSPQGMDLDFRSSSRKLVECRICHDEDEDSNMEVPCSCCGSLKVSCSLIGTADYYLEIVLFSLRVKIPVMVCGFVIFLNSFGPLIISPNT